MEQQPSDSDSNMTLLDLPENLLLHHILCEFAAAPHTLLHFSCTSKQAHRLASAPRLWASFCQEHVASELASCFAHPEHWRAANHKQLWIGLLLPYGQLLGRLWHSTTSPNGMLLAVDAEAPRLVARSIYCKTLNGGPFCHEIFAVELLGPHSKAAVTCWRDKHRADMYEGQAQLAPAGHAGNFSSALATTTAAAAGDGAGSGDSCSSSGSSGSVVVNPASGFELHCQGNCDNLAIEITSRRLAGQRYAAVRQQYSAASMQQQQQTSRQSDSSSSANSGAAFAGSSNDGSAPAQEHPPASLAPLPEMRPASHIDLFHLITVSEAQLRGATPVFRPLNLGPWLPAACSQATSGASSQPATAASSLAAAAAAAGSLEPEAADVCAGASPAALSLPGCWRGTYGSHAIELVQLQLLLAPVGYDVFAAQSAEGDAAAAAVATAAAAVVAGAVAADALAADNAADAAPGVLLAGVAGLTSATAQTAGRVVNAVEADVHQGQQQQPLHATEYLEGAGNVVGQQQQDVEATATQEQQRQQRQLLLVATKLTGDVNVPAGAVTFAVDLGSRCTAGAGSRLVLPPGTDSDVQLNRAGMRQLRVKERYRGRAQIAYTKFERPQVIAAELLLFDSPDCMGLLWKRPVDSFSLFSRASQLPGHE